MSQKIIKVLIIGEKGVLPRAISLVLEVGKELNLSLNVHHTTVDTVATMVFKNFYQKIIQIYQETNIHKISSEIFEKGSRRCWVL